MLLGELQVAMAEVPPDCIPMSAEILLGVVTDLAEVSRLGTAKAEENLGPALQR